MEVATGQLQATSVRSAPADRRVDLLLIGLAIAIALGYLTLGVGPVMDDWYTLNRAHFDGALRAAGPDQIAARPVASLVYAFVFGVLGRHLAPTLLLMALANAGSAILLRRLLGRVVSPSLAVLAAITWLVLPTTTTMEAWASASNISLALLCALATLHLVAGPEPSTRSAAAAAALAASGVLSYEAVAVLIGAGVVAVALASRRRATVRACGAATAGAVAAFGWVVANWHPNKRIGSGWSDVSDVIPANLTWGVAPGVLGTFVGAAVLAATVAAAVPALGRVERIRSARPALVIGWTVLLIGVLPFVKYSYGPIGAGDRVNVVSSLGGAVLVATTAWLAVGSTALRIGVAAIAVTLLSAEPRWLMMRSWSLAGDDGRAIETAVREEASPGDLVVIGPALVHRNGVTAMQHPDIVERAVELILDDERSRGGIATSEAELEAADGVRIDLRSIIDDPDAPGTR